MKQSDFIEDAQLFVALAAPKIGTGMKKSDTVQAILWLSFAMERCLKHALYSINPVFVLEASEFKHAVPALYREKILSSAGDDEIHKNPNENLITFRISLSRGKVFSAAAQQNKQLLYTVATYRDIVAHRTLSELECADVAKLLQRDAYPLVKNFADEQGVSVESYFGNESSRLKKASESLIIEEAFNAQMKDRISNHKNLWVSRKGNVGLIKKAKGLTNALTEKSARPDYAYEGAMCPACGNECVIRIAPDYDYADGKSYLIGVYADHLKCYFCDLELSSYQELNYVDADALLSEGD